MFVKSMRAAVMAVSTVALLAGGQAMAQDKPAAAQGAAPAAAPASDDPVVARVNGQEIKRSEVMASLQQLGPQIQQIPLATIYPQVLDGLIASRLLVAQGYKQKLEATPEVKARLKEAEQQFVEEAYLRAAIDSRLTEDRLRKRYDQFTKETPPQEEVRARHILTETKEEADEILKQLKGGAKFEDLAAAQKIDQASAAQQGDLGYFTKDMMVKEFADAAFAMKPGQVSTAPVQSQFGWHVIKVEDKRTQTLPTFDELQPQLRQAVAQEIAREVVAELRNGAKVETFAIDGTAMPAAPAGDAGTVGGQAGQRN
ncbi:MAG: hypothetical protein RLY86_2327 [Pseudomonadota bacterium]|jgi:peptidyl-prolyl cis-trans isomerase C